MSNLRKLAEGKPCMIRIPQVCNFDRETTVLCHFRLVGISGMSKKSPDWLGAWGCSACHAYVDTHKDAGTQLDFALGVFRTQYEIERLKSPYGDWCRDPSACEGKGYCPLDPTCGD